MTPNLTNETNTRTVLASHFGGQYLSRGAGINTPKPKGAHAPFERVFSFLWPGATGSFGTPFSFWTVVLTCCEPLNRHPVTMINTKVPGSYEPKGAISMATNLDHPLAGRLEARLEQIRALARVMAADAARDAIEPADLHCLAWLLASLIEELYTDVYAVAFGETG